MPKLSYRTSGICSTRIEAVVEDGIVRQVEFVSGCPGNTTAVARLVEGRPVTEIIRLLQGIPCGGRPTSCPDQLARILAQYLARAKRGENVAGA
jgi:uncharacterized protein (TIGR03905 family)